MNKQQTCKEAMHYVAKYAPAQANNQIPTCREGNKTKCRMWISIEPQISNHLHVHQIIPINPDFFFTLQRKTDQDG